MDSQTADRHHRQDGVSATPGTGGLAKLVRDYDWSQTPLGPEAEWPQSLRTTVNILLASRYAMWMGWGKDLTFLYNDAYRPTLGFKHPAALGSTAANVWAEIWQDIGPRIETVLSTGQATYDEALLLFLERSGFREETYHTFSYSPLRDDDGRLNGLLCVVAEDTERVIGERRMLTLRDVASGLAASTTEKEVLASVSEQLAKNNKDLPFVICYLFDPQGQSRLAFTTGFMAEHPVAASHIPADADVPWSAHKIFHQPSMYMSEVSANWAQSSPLPSGAWTEAPNQALLVPIGQQGHEHPAGFLIVGINPYRRFDAAYSGFLELVAGQLAAGIANARAYEEERRRSESLAELDRAKTAFFSNVSHEFRTPLTLLLAPVEDLLSKAESTPSLEDFESLKVVHRNARRLQRLVNTLLDFSRIEAGRVQANYEPTDLAAFTSELASSFCSAMERADLEFAVECDSLLEPVYVDHEMWEKVVLNLVSNALKYTRQGSVRVRLAATEDQAQLSVVDTGVGIPAEDLPSIFERFRRVEGTQGRTHEGTGIGLALVQELVGLHGGTVSATSDFGRGSTFTVLVPFGDSHLPKDRVKRTASVRPTTLHASAYVEEALRWLPEEDNSLDLSLDRETQPSDLRKLAGRRSRVLLADDNADMRNYVRRLLSSQYDVTAVSDGEAAFNEAVADPPDLVLTDVMMPRLDGFGLLRKLRGHERTKTIPILMLSARAGEESRVEGLDAGADDYLVKPFAARELLARVDAHVSLTRMRRQVDQERRLNELRLGLVLESTAMVAWEWDPHADKITRVGDVLSVFGKDFSTSAEGFRLVYPEDQLSHREKVERVAREGGAYHSEFRIRRGDTGATAWLEERATGITDEQGSVVRVVGVVADISDRKAIEQEIRQKNEDLVKVNRELEEFAYVASHDLQEPLRMVNIYTQLLLRRGGLRDDQQTSQFAEFVRTGVSRMEELIHDLLTYSRVVHQDQEEVVTADLNAALDEALSVLRLRVEETRATIARGPLPFVIADERQLALVFQNLLSNALKYQKEGTTPKIDIWAEQREGECVVSVRGNGIGFAPSHAERIFGLFKRLHRDAYPGTGLGLAICKRILERYGGRIWAESEGEGRGSLFSMCLPEVRHRN